MSLEDTKKELEEQLEAALKAEAEEVPEEEPAEPEKQDEPEEKDAEEEKEPEKPEEKPEEKLDDSGYARLRREAQAEKRRAEQLERELAEERARKQPETVEEAPQVSPEVQELIHERTRERAWAELEAFEAQVQAPDYGEVTAAYSAALAQSIRIQNPELTPAQIVEQTKQTILNRAAALMRKGFENPAEEMYHQAKELGFKAKPKEEAPVEEVKKPDMAKLAANRARSTNMTAASGKSEGQLTPMAATNMTAGEWSKLSKAQKDAIFKQIA